MNQLEQKDLIYEELALLEGELEYEEGILDEFEETVIDAQTWYNAQDDIVRGIERKIKELKSQIGAIAEGQLSIEDYDL